MLLCATSPDKSQVVILEPAEDSKIGEAISIDGYDLTPDAVLNPKHKVWEKVVPDLTTDGECVAMFKGVPLSTSQGPVACTLKNAMLG
jgi:hypothetical protein